MIELYQKPRGLPMYFYIEKDPEDPRDGIIVCAEVHPQAVLFWESDLEQSLRRFRNHSRLIELIDRCSVKGFYKARQESVAREANEFLSNPDAYPKPVVSVPY